MAGLRLRVRAPADAVPNGRNAGRKRQAGEAHVCGRHRPARETADADAWLVHRGRFLDVTFLLEVGEEPAAVGFAPLAGKVVRHRKILPRDRRSGKQRRIRTRARAPGVPPPARDVR
jgi:hypothetical protein